MKKELDKWQFWVSVHKDYMRIESGWRVFDFAILKFISFPGAGGTITKEHYTGFRIMFRFWFPFEKI